MLIIRSACPGGYPRRHATHPIRRAAFPSCDGMPGRSEPEVGRRKRSRCTHHWVIETANGVTSKGLCKLCGSVRRIRNAPPHRSLYMRGSKGLNLGQFPHNFCDPAPSPTRTRIGSCADSSCAANARLGARSRRPTAADASWHTSHPPLRPAGLVEHSEVRQHVHNADKAARV